MVLKGLETLNKYNWFPICTFILGLPGEKREDTRQSLDLLFALKNAKWCVIPTLFVPLEDTRPGTKQRAKLIELTDLQREFFFTAWRYNLDFWRGFNVRWKFCLAVPLYYYLLGRKLFGKAIKYPLLRFGHFPEWLLRGKLYLDFGDGRTPRYRAPGRVEIPAERVGSSLPVLRPRDSEVIGFNV